MNKISQTNLIRENEAQTSIQSRKTSISNFKKVFEDFAKVNTYHNSNVLNQTSGAKAPTSMTEIFEKASEKYQVPYDLLVSVAKAESNFNPDSVSRSGAQGVMQLMPATAKYLGVDDPHDAYENIMGGARYLSEKLAKYDGNIELALASYNAGSGAVAKYGGVPPYKETQNYIKKIYSYMNSEVEVPNTMNDTGENDMEALSKSKVVIGSGTSSITMTYEAYMRYLELGNTGVG